MFISPSLGGGGGHVSTAIDPSLVQDQALQLLEHVPGATIILDPGTGSILFANQALGRLVGVDPEVLVGQPIAALDRDMGADLDWGQSVQRLRQAGEGALHRTLCTPDGPTIPVEVRARLVAIADTEVVLATLTDVSENQRLNADLGERVKELALLHRVSELTHAWAGTTETLLQEVAEAIPPSWQYPEITEARISYGDTMVATDRFSQGVAQIEAAVETSDGTPVHVEVAYTEPRPSADNGPFLAEEVALIRSVAAILRAHVEHRLQAREADQENERLRTVLDAAPLILFELDADGTIIFQRGQGLAGIGRKEGENVGIRFQDLHPGRKDMTDLLEEIRQGRAVEVTLPVRGRWLHIQTRPRYDDDGRLLGATGVALDITERQEALRDAQENQRRFELATEAASDVLWEWNAGTDQLQWSHTYAARFGEDGDEITTFEAWSQRVHPDARAGVVAGIDAWLESDQRTWSDTYRLQRADGTYAHVEDRAAVIRDDTGAPSRVVGALVDRTEGVEAEHERAFQVSMLDQIGEAVIATDLEGVVQYWNRAAEETYGYTRDEAIGKDINDLNVPEVTAEQAEEIMAALRHGETWSGEVIVRDKDGREFPARVTDTPLHDAHDRLVGVIGISTDISDQKALEQALRDSEARQRAWLEAAPDTLGTLDPTDGRITWINKAFETLTGWDTADWVGRPFTDLIHPEDLARTLEDYQAAIDGQQPPATELRFETLGGYRWVSVLGRPVYRGDRIVDFFVVARDVSERVEAEQALRESEERFRELAETVDDIFWTLSADGELTYMGPGFEQITGIPVDASLDWDGVMAVIPPDDAPAVEAWLRGLMAGEQDHDILEHRAIAADGEARWATSEGYAVRDEEGRVERVIGMTRDVHDLVTTRQRLEASEQAFQSLAENIEENFWLVDADGETVLYNSPGFAEIFGVAWEDLEDPQDWFDLIHPEDREEVVHHFIQLFADAEPGEITYRVVRPDGEVRWVQSLIRPDTGDDGTTQRFAGITRDITQEREAEAHREEALLRQAEAEHYQEVAEFKSHFLNTAAHELSTPLTPLKFQVEALRSGMMGDLSSQQVDAIGIIDRSVDRFSRLTRDLLDAARLQAGQLSLQRREIDLSDLIREVAGPFQEVADQAGVELTVEPNGPLRCNADPDRLGQVLTNLVDNAIKFTPEGGTVTVQAVANGQGPVLRVLDTGIGMDRDQMAKLFEPFTQVHDPDATKQRGTGLGLYISKGIVEQHGGSLDVASPGKTQGTTFTVQLPAEQPDMQGAQP